MLTLNLIDRNFPGQQSVCPGKIPRLVEWDRSGRTQAPQVYTDWAFGHVRPNTPGQFGWLLESPVAQAGQYARTKLTEAEPHLEAIFTSERNRVHENPAKYRYAPVGGIWIEDPGIRPKTKGTSMLASTKADTVHQTIRTLIANEIEDIVDVYGHGRAREPARVEDALDDYMFSFAIENFEVAGYWTEKILNCFATGTIPIYRGAPDIGHHFDARGIIGLNDDPDPYDLTPARYESMRPYMIANFHEALRYEIPDDRLVADHFTEWL